VQIDHPIRAAKHLRRLARPRPAVALTVIVALLLPGAYSLTAPDPNWLLGVPAASEAPVGHGAGHHDRGAADPADDYSGIPGAAGHPSDHNCSPCQVLKYLASYLPQPPIFLHADTQNAVPRVERGGAQRSGHTASLPPSRAPPRPLV